jgi:hypothetical protein
LILIIAPIAWYLLAGIIAAQLFQFSLAYKLVSRQAQREVDAGNMRPKATSFGLITFSIILWPMAAFVAWKISKTGVKTVEEFDLLSLELEFMKASSDETK